VDTDASLWPLSLCPVAEPILSGDDQAAVGRGNDAALLQTNDEGSPVNDQSTPAPVTADPPEPPATDDSGATPAELVDAMEERVFSEKGNPAQEAEQEPAQDAPDEEPPE
jgi:hypothetical protein